MRTSFLIITLLTATAGADPTVLAVDGKDIYVELGAKDGVGTGSELELLHEIIAKDPTTGTTLHDQFALGTIIVAKSGDGVSVAHAVSDELAARVLAGDHVRLVSQKKAYVDPWAEQVAASKPAAPQQLVIDHAALASEAWQATLGHSLEDRIATWTALATRDPQTPYRHAIETELHALRDQLVARDAALAKARSGTVDDRSPRIADLVAQLDGPPPHAPGALLEVASIEDAVPGKPLELAFLARSPAAIGHAWLYVRSQGEPGFHRSELTPDGDAYLRGRIDGALVRGAVDWYVEVAAPGAQGAEPILGSQTDPRTIEVARVVDEPPIAHGRSHVELHFDDVVFDSGPNKKFDEYYQAEADFGYRFIDPIYAVRLGFGTLSGTGGPTKIIDDDLTHGCLNNGVYSCTQITFSYVYTEFEFRLRRNVALMLRPQVGALTTDSMATDSSTHCQSSDTTGCAFVTGVGGRVRLRLGEEQGTNLVLGASFSRGVGTLLEAGYHWLPAPVVPVQITVQVTDQPVIADFGVRLVADVGYRNHSWIYPSARVSYQARGLDHTGVSGGAALNFDW